MTLVPLFVSIYLDGSTTTPFNLNFSVLFKKNHIGLHITLDLSEIR